MTDDGIVSMVFNHIQWFVEKYEITRMEAILVIIVIILLWQRKTKN